MNRVIRADEQLCSRPHEPRRRLKHHLTHRIPAVAVYQMLISAQRETVQADLRMFMRPENCRAFQTDCAVTKRGAFSTDRDDADVLHESVSSESTQRSPRRARLLGRIHRNKADRSVLKFDLKVGSRDR